jgi:hypothetical protein
MHRRQLLRMAATSAAVLGLPARVFAETSGPGLVMGALSAYMSAAGIRPLPAEKSPNKQSSICSIRWPR